MTLTVICKRAGAQTLVESMKSRGHEVRVVRSDASRKEIVDACIGTDLVHFATTGRGTWKIARYVETLGIPMTALFPSRINKSFRYLTFHILAGRLFSRCSAIQYTSQAKRDAFESTLGRETEGYVIPYGVDYMDDVENMFLTEIRLAYLYPAGCRLIPKACGIRKTAILSRS